MPRFPLALLFAVPLFSGCVTLHATRALDDKFGAPPPSHHTTYTRLPPVELAEAVRTPDGVYHLLVRYQDDEQRHYVYDPGHPELARARRDRWPSASQFHTPESGPTPTMTPTVGELPEGVPIAIRASDAEDEDGDDDGGDDGDRSGGPGPELRMNDGVVNLREGGEFQRLAIVPSDRNLVRRSQVYRRHSSAGRNVAKLLVVPLAVLADALLLPFWLAALLGGA